MSSAADEGGGRTSSVGLVREAVALGVAALATRGELAALELTEARNSGARWLVLALLASMLLLAALLVASLLIVSLFWDTYRTAALGVLAAVYAAAGGGLVAWLVTRLRAAPPLLQATLSELQRDSDALRGRSRPPA